MVTLVVEMVGMRQKECCCFFRLEEYYPGKLKK